MPGRGLLALFIVSVFVAAGASAQPQTLLLPTRNDALLRGDGPGFYQYTDRYFERRRSRPWQGGQYGFVRNLRRTRHGIVRTRFHEGVDIKPIYRDGTGEPLDTVRAVDAGRVVYVNTVPEHSNYGLYVVVEHWWLGSPYYTLSAHLNEVWVRTGERVAQGAGLGRLGYTGRGIDRRRAHVHFEINLLLNEAFESWYAAHYKENDVNHHGIFSGLNLGGMDVPALYLGRRDEAWLTITDVMARKEAFFKVAVPAAEDVPDLLWRYPWMSSFDAFGEAALPPAWEVYFAASGLPLRIEPLYERVEAPVVTVLERSPIEYRYLTNGFVEGTGRDYALTKSGLRRLDLLTRVELPSVPRLAW